MDDNVAVRASTADIIELAGYEVNQTGCPDDAVQRLNQGDFDLLVLDLGLDRCGLEVLDRAASLPPVIAISGVEADFSDPRVCSFIAKPVAPDRLLMEIRGCLSS